MLPSFERRRAGSLRVHDLAAQLLGRDLAPRFPSRADSEQVEVLPDGTVVTGARTVLRAKRSDQLDVRVRHDLADEDGALVAGLVVKDVLAGCTDPIALGTAWGRFRGFVERLSRPRKGYKHDCYVRKHGMSAAERLALIVLDAFGYGYDQLCRMQKAKDLPVELHDALRTKAVSVKTLAALAALPWAKIAEVRSRIRSGTPAAEAVAMCLCARQNRPAPRTALRRLLRAGDRAATDLGDRVNELGYLTDADRARVERCRALYDALLRLATEKKVQEHVCRALSRLNGG